MPNSISVSYSEKHMGALKIACAGNAMVLMCRASELLNHSQGGKPVEPGPGEEGPTLASVKAALVDFISDERHASQDPGQREAIIRSFVPSLWTGFVDVRQAVVVPPGWVLAVAAPKSSCFSGVSLPFYDSPAFR